MRPFWRFAACVLLIGCVGELPLEERRCPCAPGFACCAWRDVCLAPSETCEARPQPPFRPSNGTTLLAGARIGTGVVAPSDYGEPWSIDATGCAPLSFSDVRLRMSGAGSLQLVGLVHNPSADILCHVSVALAYHDASGGLLVDGYAIVHGGALAYSGLDQPMRCLPDNSHAYVSAVEDLALSDAASLRATCTFDTPTPLHASFSELVATDYDYDALAGLTVRFENRGSDPAYLSTFVNVAWVFLLDDASKPLQALGVGDRVDPASLTLAAGARGSAAASLVFFDSSSTQMAVQFSFEDSPNVSAP